MAEYDDKRVIQSWRKNANAWIGAVQNKEIESRNLVTNKAIIDAVMERNPTTALDIVVVKGGYLAHFLLVM